MSKQKADYKVKVEFKENGKKRSKTLSLEKYNETKEELLNGNTLLSLEFKLNGKRHREDGPAKISYKDDGSVYREYWYLNNEKHREDGPAYISYKDDGSVYCEYWFLNGKKHRADGPAEIEYRGDGSVRREEWYLNDERHREDGPAIIERNDDGGVEREYWFLNGVWLLKEVVLKKLDHYKSDTEEIYLTDGKFHREDGPAKIYYNDDGSVYREEWYLNDEKHREDGPAKIYYNDDGSVYREEWYLNGEEHREDGPALIYYNDDGSVYREYWYLNNEKHREDGPAEIYYNDDGSVSSEEWYLNGEELEIWEFAQRLELSHYKSELQEVYLKDGKLHREDGPAKIYYNDDGSVDEEYWYLNGKYVSFKSFAEHLGVDHLKSNKEELYLKEGKLHREDGPAWIYYNDDKTTKREEWYKDGQLHREDGPAIYGEEINSTRQVEQYYLKGKKLAKKAFFKKMNLDPEAASFGMKIEEHKEGDVLHKTDGPALLKYNQKGTLLEESWYLNGKLHREDGPAYTKWTNKGLLKEEKFYNNGVMSNEDHPSHIEYGTNEKILRHTYYVDDKIHRSDNPAVIKFRDKKPETEDFYLNGEEVSIVDFANHLGVEHYKSDRNEVYLKDGKLHREDGPAHIIRRSSGSVKIEQWYIDGELHREKEPAFVEYHSDGSVEREHWYLNNELHRADSPAEISYNDDGSVDEEYWYLNGEELEIWEFAQRLELSHYKSELQEVYLKDGKLHREDGPAFVEYHSDSSPKIYQWYQNGQQHRLDGPAYLQFESALHYMNPSDVVREEWYLHGEKTTEEVVNEERKKQKSTTGDDEVLEKHEYEIEVSNVFGRLEVWNVTKEQYNYWIKDNRYKELSFSGVPDGTPEDMNFQEDYGIFEVVGLDAYESSITLYENTKDGQVEISDNLKGFRKSKEDINLSDYGKYVFVRTSAMKGGQGSTFTTNGQIDITKLKFSTMHHRLLGEVFVGLSYDGEDLDFDGDWGEEKWWEVHLLKT